MKHWMHTWISFLIIFCTSVQDFKTNEPLSKRNSVFFLFLLKTWGIRHFVLWPTKCLLYAFCQFSLRWFPNTCCIVKCIIGIKHDFLCINICWAPREVLKPEPGRRGFQHLPRGTADVNVLEKHVWSLLLHKNFFFARKLRRNCFKMFFFSCTYNGAEKHVTCERFENAASRAKLTSSLLCMLLMMTRVIMTAPECLFVNPQSRALTVREFPC